MNELQEAIAEEVGEVETMPELKALWCFGQSENNGYGDADCVPAFRAAVARLRGQTPVFQGVVEGPMDRNVEEQVRELNREILAIENVVGCPVQRGGRRYKLLSTDVGWSTKSQVHGIMAILCGHAKVGDVLEESDIVRMMVANERTVLQTRQGGKKIWNYYKGDHVDGLTAHGNVERM